MLLLLTSAVRQHTPLTVVLPLYLTSLGAVGLVDLVPAPDRTRFGVEDSGHENRGHLRNPFSLPSRTTLPTPLKSLQEGHSGVLTRPKRVRLSLPSRLVVLVGCSPVSSFTPGQTRCRLVDRPP